MNFVGHYLFTSSPSPVKEGFYMAKFDEISSSESTGSKPRELYVTNVLLTVDEVLLNRMEAYAMRKDYNRAHRRPRRVHAREVRFHAAVERSVYTTTDRANYQRHFAHLRTDAQTARARQNHSRLPPQRVLPGRTSLVRHPPLPPQCATQFEESLLLPARKEDPRKLLQIPTQAIERGLRPNPRERNAPQR